MLRTSSLRPCSDCSVSGSSRPAEPRLDHSKSSVLGCEIPACFTTEEEDLPFPSTVAVIANHAGSSASDPGPRFAWGRESR